MDVCLNPDILRVIWFFKMIVNIVKIIIPIALIVLGIVDFSKATITNDEKVQQKSGKLFFKRLLCAVLVFTIPWLIEVFMVTLGNLIGKDGEVNFTDCIENAKGEKIEALESTGCVGEKFIINYYNEDATQIIDSEVVCTNQEFNFKKITKLKGWDFKNKPFGAVFFDASTKYVITEDALESIVSNYGGFDLIPILE